jgi:hypothetical protein
MRAADLGYAPRFQAFFLASSVVPAKWRYLVPPHAADACRWAPEKAVSVDVV